MLSPEQQKNICKLKKNKFPEKDRPAYNLKVLHFRFSMIFYRIIRNNNFNVF